MTNQPFWLDELKNFESYKPIRLNPSITVGAYIMLMLITLVPVLIAFVISKYMGYFLILLYLVSLYISQIRRKQYQARNQEIIQVQQRAREKTGASTIGSAIHVAGHPFLEREQPVVLALVDGALCYYAYDSNIPLDTLPLEDIKAIHTVVYDDDRIPHLEAIDSTAQALQIEFERDGKEWACLFRRMLKVKPVDWYQAIQVEIVDVNN